MQWVDCCAINVRRKMTVFQLSSTNIEALSYETTIDPLDHHIHNIKAFFGAQYVGIKAMFYFTRDIGVLYQILKNNITNIVVDSRWEISQIAEIDDEGYATIQVNTTSYGSADYGVVAYCSITSRGTASEVTL